MLNQFLNHVSGVIHIGANVGQERHIYKHHGLMVLWIEPIPNVFLTLSKNIARFPNQHAIQALIADEDDMETQLHIANNNGASSSVLELKHHQDIWPEVKYESTIRCQCTTLQTLLQRERIAVSRYDALIIDTQGSELLVLQGAKRILSKFRYIKTEVADFEAYSGCCTTHDICTFMTSVGFSEMVRRPFAHHPKVGTYFDIVFQKDMVSRWPNSNHRQET